MDVVASVEKLFALLVGSVCLILLLRQFIGARRRARLDARLRHALHATRRSTRAIVRWPTARRDAQREAEAAIRRARAADVEHDGNVVRPAALRKPRKLH